MDGVPNSKRFGGSPIGVGALEGLRVTALGDFFVEDRSNDSVWKVGDGGGVCSKSKLGPDSETSAWPAAPQKASRFSIPSSSIATSF